MISLLGSEGKGFLFGLPLVVSFHDDNTAILDNFGKGPFVGQFFDTPIDNHIELSFLSPLHERKFSFRFFFGGLRLLTIIIDCSCYLLLQWLLLFSSFFFYALFLCGIQIAPLDHWDVGCRAHVERT